MQHRVVVIGAGIMGARICKHILRSGYPVALIDPSEEAIENAEKTIGNPRETLTTHTKIDALPNLWRAAMMVIEVVPEVLSLKHQVIADSEAFFGDSTVIASNTSGLPTAELTKNMRCPERFVITHFFNPADLIPAVELVPGPKTSQVVVAKTAAFLEGTGKKVARLRADVPGFIANRLMFPYMVASMEMLLRGTPMQVIDATMRDYGFAMGPFRMGDLAGNDIGWAIRKRRSVERADMKYSRTADKLCELGRFGQKTGAGWYDYQAGKRDAIPSDLVNKMIEDHRKELGITPRKISDEEIVQRLVFSLVNEAAHILEEGIASKASDIDMVYLTGYGFPIHRGGPMHYASEVGLFNVVQAMDRFAKNPLDDAAFWKPAPLLAKLAAEGKAFQ